MTQTCSPSRGNDTPRRTTAVGLAAALAVVCVGVGQPGAIARAANPIQVGSAKQVFIDAKFLASASGVKIVVNKPRVLSEKLIVQTKPWEDFLIGGYQTVIQEGDRVRMWYLTRDKRGMTGMAYAYSDDYGATWTKPNLGIVQYEGSTNNNLVITGADGSVFPNRPDAPPEQRYVMFAGSNKAYVSPDGFHWTQYGKVPFLNMGSYVGLDSQNVMFWDTRLQKYVAYPRVWDGGWSGVRTVGRSESGTLGDFPSPVIVFRADGSDPSNMDFYTSAAVQYPYAADAYFMFPAAYYHEPAPPNNAGPLNIQFAASRDGITWQRYDRDDHIVRGFDVNGNPSDQWQQRSLYAGYGLSRQGDEISLYYKCNPVRHGYTLPDGSIGGTITRAIYRLDGFTSVDAAGSGDFTTPALTFGGARLLLNAAVSSNGLIKVEILDGDGSPRDGFSLSDADTLTGDSTAMPVTWRGRDDLSSLLGQPVQLHFVMAAAKLYAFQFVVDLPGDANRDGRVNDLDAAILASNWLSTSAIWSDGDFNGDGAVNDLDASILAAHWQETTQGASPVPEPSAISALLGALGGSLLCRRRR